MPLISVITPASRGVKDLSNLFRDFKNQTLPIHLWDHIVVFDGKVPEDVQKLADSYKGQYNLKFTSIAKDMGDMHRSPGTKARNYGVSLSDSKFVAFMDDDNRYRGSLLETFLSGLQENMLPVVQVAVAESRIYKNGAADKFTFIPEIGLPTFPMICHIDTASCLFQRKWLLEEPWRYEPEHDYRLIKRIVDRFKPLVYLHNGPQVDLDGIFTKNIIDWVSTPPYNRDH